MRRRLEHALPVLVLLGFATTAVLLNLLLSDAQDRGVAALEEAVEGEVSAIASTQDQRIARQLEGLVTTAQAAGGSVEFAIGSEADGRLLASVGADTPLYLVASDGTITQGQLLIGDPVGSRFAWPGFDGLPAAGEAEILPVAPRGYTTEQPVMAYVVPVAGGRGEGVVGAAVLEEVVEPGSDFNLEVRPLDHGDTGEYVVFDRNGVVVASSDEALVAETLEDERLLSEPPGVYRAGGRLVAVADVPAAHWRVAFRQDEGEFGDALERPVESVGRILILVLLGAGFVVTIGLDRRLRSARAEQARLERLGAAQQELVSIVTHELRTPVAGVVGFLDTTLANWDSMDDAERKRSVARAAGNARRLEAMARDVLDAQTVEEGHLVGPLEPVDLLEQVRAATRSDATPSGSEEDERPIDVALPAGPVWVAADAARLHRVLVNLLDNAHRSSPAVEPVEVSVTVEGGEAVVAVCDHGAGIEREALAHVFDRFVRGRDHVVSGTGLGLYISRQVVEAHGGRIWAESGPAGTVFRVALPTIDPVEEATGEPVD